jgi:hypothetical protein
MNTTFWIITPCSTVNASLVGDTSETSMVVQRVTSPYNSGDGNFEVLPRFLLFHLHIYIYIYTQLLSIKYTDIKFYFEGKIIYTFSIII